MALNLAMSVPVEWLIMRQVCHQVNAMCKCGNLQSQAIFKGFMLLLASAALLAPAVYKAYSVNISPMLASMHIEMCRYVQAAS